MMAVIAAVGVVSASTVVSEVVRIARRWALHSVQAKHVA